MGFDDVSHLINNVLPGLNSEELGNTNFDILFAALNLRLRAAATPNKSTRLALQISRQSITIVGCPREEYILNEMQYETRLHSETDPERESKILDHWTRSIMRRKGVDASLDFYSTLKIYRLERALD